MSNKNPSHTVFPCPVCAQVCGSVEELEMHGYNHNPQPQYQYLTAANGDITVFMVDTTTQTFVFFKTWTQAEVQAEVDQRAARAAAAAVVAARAPILRPALIAIQPAPTAQAMATAQPVFQALTACRCQWADCSAVFADEDQLFDHLDHQHVGTPFAGPRVQICSWRSCTVGPRRDRAEMRAHLMHHTPGARPFFCNGGSACGERSRNRKQRATHHHGCAHEQAHRRL